MLQSITVLDIHRITKDFAGTPEDPVVVESAFEERIIGVPDPEDDCLVIWDLIKADEPPKQIIEGGEYFVLKTSKPPAWTGLPESVFLTQLISYCIYASGPMLQSVLCSPSHQYIYESSSPSIARCQAGNAVHWKWGRILFAAHVNLSCIHVVCL